MMYVPFLLSTLLMFCIDRVSTVNCPASSGQWCETKAIARACDVTDQCERYVWKDADQDNRINLTLYYETLCPGCRMFVTKQLWNAYQSVLSIVNISFVPYGNAREVYQPDTQLYQFYCQHGADECYGNIIHACVLNFYPNTTEHLPFIYCTETASGDVETVAEKCAETTKIDFNQIIACAKSRLGNQLQHNNAMQTEALQPAHQYVPWITINGEHTKEMEFAALINLVGLLCKTYKGTNPPAACKKNL